jgi:tRNA-dihydrouridine synthase
MEGITGYLFRAAHAAVFGPADQYLTPFLSPNQNLRFTTRERQDVLPEHNEGLNVVPQLLTNNADHFVWCAKELAAMGYRQVNLNLGCPSGTVAAKGKGAGFLAYPEQLDRFLEQIFSQLAVNISVKTRVGKASADEFDRLLEIYSRYPICELIVHPRTQADFYRGTPDLSAFRKAVERSPAPVCYNGDLFSVETLSSFHATFPQVDQVMAGRGVAANPSLLRQFRGGAPAGKDELREFHDRLYVGYRQIMPGERAVLARMKELWSYLLFQFTGRERYIRPLRKASRLSEYESVIAALFREQQVIPSGSFDPAHL